MPNNEEIYSEVIEDIVAASPSWIVSWGTSMFVIIICMLITLSAIIKYPEIIRTELTIESPDAPKPVVSKISGKLMKILVADNTNVQKGQILAFLESTADHEQVFKLLDSLKKVKERILMDKYIYYLTNSDDMQLGELQDNYQQFFREYLEYKSSIANGYYIKKKNILENDLTNLDKEKKQLQIANKNQAQTLKLATDDYEMYKKLGSEKILTRAELRLQEAKYIVQKSQLLQSESALIHNSNDNSAKQKEILDITNQILENKQNFLQALNTLISQIESWKNKYVLYSTQSGKLEYEGIIQVNQVLAVGQEIFFIDPSNAHFFGNMQISQFSLGKVKIGKDVLIKLKSYPFEEYGLIRGKIKYIASIPTKDSIYNSKVEFDIITSKELKKGVELKEGMRADAEIVTQKASILQRIARSIIRTTK